MKFDKALSRTIEELEDKYKEVIYKGYEIVSMTSNTTTSNYMDENINISGVEAELIRNRFEEIEGEITAIKAVFDIKYQGRRKFNRHEEYFKITNQLPETKVLFDSDKKRIDSACINYPMGSKQIGDIAEISGQLYGMGLDATDILLNLLIKTREQENA